jgi:hypothetical protein
MRIQYQLMYSYKHKNPDCEVNRMPGLCLYLIYYQRKYYQKMYELAMLSHLIVIASRDSISAVSRDSATFKKSDGGIKF